MLHLRLGFPKLQPDNADHRPGLEAVVVATSYLPRLPLASLPPAPAVPTSTSTLLSHSWCSRRGSFVPAGRLAVSVERGVVAVVDQIVIPRPRPNDSEVVDEGNFFAGVEVPGIGPRLLHARALELHSRGQPNSRDSLGIVVPSESVRAVRDFGVM